MVGPSLRFIYMISPKMTAGIFSKVARAKIMKIEILSYT